MIYSRLRTLTNQNHNSNSCNNTQLTISEGAYIDEINTVLWRYCFADPPPIISSTKNIVRVNYNIRNKFLFLDRFDSFRMEWIADGCGGILDKYEGQFTSPGYPGYYPPSTTCEWKIFAKHGNIIEITIEDFSFETIRTCSYDYLVIYSGHDDSGPELLRICHKQTKPITITSGGNEVFIRFESDVSTEQRGFKASYTEIESKCGGKFTAPEGIIHTSNYPQNYDADSSCMWYIEIADTHLINLTFVDFSTRNFPTQSKDYVLVYDGDINGKLLLNHSGNSIPSPIISSSNKLLVSFEVSKRELRAKGFKANYSTACGAKLLTNDSGIISSDSLAGALHDKCSWTIVSDTPKSKVTLTFTHIDIVHYMDENRYQNRTNNQSNVDCSEEIFNTIFRVLDGPDPDAPEIIKFCKSNPIPPPIFSNGPAIRLEFISNAEVDSFTAIYSIRSIACGGTYDSIRGTISSPNYPNNYLRDSECVWILKSSVGNNISLNFITFELEEDEFCNEDYVEVREQNSNGSILGIFCGSNLPPNNISSSLIWIKFRSSSLGSAKGFTANFNYVTENYLNYKSGEISNPLYPRQYRNSDDYSWTITVNQGKRIQIVLKEIIWLSSFHNLNIYDGSDDQSLILFQLDIVKYYNGFNKSIISSDNIIYIKLRSVSKSLTGISYLLSWTEIDRPYPKILFPEFDISSNKTSFDYYLSPMTNTSVIINSPGYPYGYAPNLNVVWTIHTEPLHHIEIEFTDIDLYPIQSSSVSSLKDYIVVETIDPYTSNKILLKKIFKNTNNIADKKLIGKNKIIITFVSNHALNGTGFSAKAKLKCGGELDVAASVIEVSVATSSYTSGQICIWNVTARPGKTILVKLIAIKLFEDNMCTDSYILLKNGLYEDSPLLGQGKYCNITNVAPISTTDNKLQIKAKITTQEMIKISFEEKSFNCGGQIYLIDVNNFTEITSPSYPNIPSPHIECIWTVVAPAGERLFVNIEDLDLASEEECSKEYVEFRDGAARFSPLIKRICMNNYILDIETTDNFLYIKYFTDLNIPSNGFKLNVTIAKCGGTRRSYSGIITSPNYPGSYEPNMECEYKIIVPKNRRVVLNFDIVNLKRRFPSIGTVEDTNNDTYDDTLTIYDVDPFNNTRLIISKIFGSNTPSTPIKSSGRELVIKFKSQIKNGPFYLKNIQAKFLLSYVSEYNECDKVFTMESGEITSPRFDSSHVERLNCMYQIKVPLGRRVTVEVIEGKSIAQSCNSFELMGNRDTAPKELLVAISGEQYWSYRMHCIDPVIHPTSLNYIYESTSNEISILYEYLRGNQRGFRLKFSSNKPALCGGIVDANIRGKIQLPLENVTSFLCKWDFTNTNGTIVMVADIKIKENKMTYSPDTSILLATDEEDTILLKKYCPVSNTNDKFTILSPLSLTKFKVSSNSKLIKFTATIDYFVNTCGGILNGRKITITSPNYPKNYQQLTNCAWLVVLPEDGNINIQFHDIDLESPCDNNRLTIYDGPDPVSPILGKYCGNLIPENLLASSNKILIEFSADSGNNNKKGFNLTLESVQIGCGNTYVSNSGEFTSKNYPNLYPNNEECEWTIATWPGNKVSLQFIERFSLEQSVNCTKDYIQVSNYVNNNWEPFGTRLCGRQMPPVFNSTETKLKIRLRTDSDIQGDGFKAKWERYCGGLLTQRSGKIISPNYPRAYANDLKCNYTIFAPGKIIQLFFKSFELEDSGCRYDNLTIYDRIDVSNNHSRHYIGSYCGENAPRTLNVMETAMLIFTTDSTTVKKGFEIYFEIQECGGEITTPGLIKSPISIVNEYNKVGYPNDENCTWIIRAPPDQVVQLVFTKFRLEPNPLISEDEEKCPFDYIVVFDEIDKKNNNSEGLGIFCGVLDNRLPEVKSKTNIMYVQFLTDSSRSNEGFVAEVLFTYDESKGCGGTIRLNQTNSMPSYILKAPKISTKTNLDCGWLILVEPSFVVQVQLVNYVETPLCSLNKTTCSCSSLKFFDGPGRMASNICQFCSGNNNYPPAMSSGSEAFIQYSVFSTDVNVNFELKINPAISNCGERILQVSNQTQILTSPKYPLPYKNNLICTWSIQVESFQQDLILHFTDIDLDDTKDCMSNYLEVRYTQWLSIISTTLRLCHEDHELELLIPNTLEPVMVTLHTNDQKTSKGFRLEYKSSKCQTNYNKRDGRIHLNYLREITTNDCVITINVGQSNLTVSAYFSTINLMTPAETNYLKIYDGPSVSSPLITTLVDTIMNPPPVFSSGPAMTIWYKSTNRYSGLVDISYTSTDQGKGCGGRMFNVEGAITSPLYPFVYRKNAACRWDIAVPRPYSISVSFRIFDLGERRTCDTDYLELYNVDQTTGISYFVTKYCGGDNPSLHVSQTGAVFIRYVTTIHNTGTGWVLHFKLKHNP